MDIDNIIERGRSANEWGTDPSTQWAAVRATEGAMREAPQIRACSTPDPLNDGISYLINNVQGNSPSDDSVSEKTQNTIVHRVDPQY